MPLGTWIAAISLLIVFTNLIGLSLYKIGHLSARVEELERWRLRMLEDLHEISDRMEQMSLEIRGIRTLIEERTSRRIFNREKNNET